MFLKIGMVFVKIYQQGGGIQLAISNACTERSRSEQLAITNYELRHRLCHFACRRITLSVLLLCLSKCER